MTKSDIREDMCILARSMFDRGLTHGSTGNISARTPDGGLVASPTGSCFGRLDPARLSLFDASGNYVSGDPPTKELPLHMAFYETRTETGAVVHLHSPHAVALSMFDGADPDDFLPHLTPYAIMLLGKVKLLPFFLPGDCAMGDAVRALDGKRSAVMLSHHGPVVAGKTLQLTCNAIEELEATAQLALMIRGAPTTGLSEADVAFLVDRFNVDWDT
jgi:ribulose-5-phosphate 4-epimerase/fuculose-1-phosphate aldolase